MSHHPPYHGPNPNLEPEDRPNNSLGHKDTLPVGGQTTAWTIVAGADCEGHVSGSWWRCEALNLFIGRCRVSSEDVVVYTSFPQPQREGALYKNWSVRVVLGQQLHLVRTLDTWLQKDLWDWNVCNLILRKLKNVSKLRHRGNIYLLYAEEWHALLFL